MRTGTGGEERRPSRGVADGGGREVAASGSERWCATRRPGESGIVSLYAVPLFCC